MTSRIYRIGVVLAVLALLLDVALVMGSQITGALPLVVAAVAL